MECRTAKVVPKRYPEWWTKQRFSSRIGRLYGHGFYCRICNREFLCRKDSRGRFNMGWLRSAVQSHSGLCDEITAIKSAYKIDKREAEESQSQMDKAVSAGSPADELGMKGDQICLWTFSRLA